MSKKNSNNIIGNLTRDLLACSAVPQNIFFTKFCNMENVKYQVSTNIISWPGSSVAIATGYGLEGSGIESRWQARFSAPVQTVPGAHPASCTMGTWSFLGIKRGRGVTLTPHPLLVPWSRKSGVIPLLPLWAV